jgi:L-galactose dehydrogenase
MEYVTLGRTGLRVSVAGLGCGGFSRLGLGTGKSEEEAVALVRHALDLGVNLLDTAAVYGTEGVVGQAIKSVPQRRDRHQGVDPASRRSFCGGARRDEPR